jgi:hypothetical protein
MNNQIKNRKDQKMKQNTGKKQEQKQDKNAGEFRNEIMSKVKHDMATVLDVKVHKGIRNFIAIKIAQTGIFIADKIGKQFIIQLKIRDIKTVLDDTMGEAARRLLMNTMEKK